MILVINQVLKVKPVTPGSKEDIFPGIKNDPESSKGEKAIVSLKVNIIQGTDLSQINDLILIGPNPINVTLINQKNSFFSGTTISIFINHLFKEGVSKEVRQYIYEGGGLFALSKKGYQTWEEQEKAFQHLAHFMLSDTPDLIMNSGKKAYILDPSPNAGKTPCHLSGRITYNKDHKPPLTEDNKYMHHVATISCRETTPVLSDYCNCHLLDHLSFYIDSLHTGEGWPIHPGQHSVQNYDEAADLEGVHLEDEGTEISLRPLFSIPEPDHALVMSLKLNDDHLKRYDALYYSYHKALGLGRKHRIQFLGYPQSEMTCVAFEAESLFHQKAYSSIHYRDASQWQLLLQISPQTYRFTFFETFGEATIYYLIKNQDLKDGNFSRVQVVVHKE
ncbi:MAG: DUF1963 domain-containing protein [Saprospiraceae bacterium]|nr:DUF1963 domain-containing protein [Saprospiraceae bacterium]